MLIGFKLSFGKHIEIDFTLTICYLNHIHIWEAILQPFGYLIPHMNKKLVERMLGWKWLLSPHTERSMRMQQMTNHRSLAELDLLDDFLFNAVLAYPEYGRKFCRKFLKILFGREFKNLNIVTQKSYGGRDIGLHGARQEQ